MALLSVCLTFYDGVDCIGGNKILLEADGTALLLDFGTNFGAEGVFFDEFLKPRLIFGFADLLTLGLLPPLKNFYRQDLTLPKVWEKYAGHPLYREVEVQGVLLSHSHVDHTGYVSYLRADLPIWTSLTTAFIAKAMQDTGSGSFFQETCYLVPRELTDGLLKAANYRKAPYTQRQFLVFGYARLPGNALSFWERCESSRELCVRPLQMLNKKAEVEGLKIYFWPVDHSIPGAGAFGIKTSAGWIVYTGDLRLHGKGMGKTQAFIREAARLKPRVLICEGTHPEVEKPVAEEEVFLNSFEVVKRAGGLVVADFGPRNVERLLSFLTIARQTGRQLVLTAKDIYLLEALHAAGEEGVPDPYGDDFLTLYDRPKGSLSGWEKVLRERFSSRCPGRLINAGEIKANEGNFVLCFSYYDFPALLDIEPRKGTYIYSSSEAFNEEMLFDQEKVRNWIDFLGMELFGSLGRDRENSGFHASGHIHGPGIEELVANIQPEMLIPVHTECKDFFRRFEGRCQVVFPGRGESIRLD